MINHNQLIDTACGNFVDVVRVIQVIVNVDSEVLRRGDRFNILTHKSYR